MSFTLTSPARHKMKKPLEKFYLQVHQVLTANESNALHILLKDYQLSGDVGPLAQGLHGLLDTPSKRQLLPQIRKLLPREHRNAYSGCLSALRNGNLLYQRPPVHIQLPTPTGSVLNTPNSTLTRKPRGNQMQIPNGTMSSVNNSLIAPSSGTLPRKYQKYAPSVSGTHSLPRRHVQMGGQTADLVTNDPNLLMTLTMSCPPGSPLGFSIRGGSENGLGIYVSQTEPGGSGHRAGLLMGDHILEVNNIDMKRIRSSSAVQVLMGSSVLKITLRRLGRLPIVKSSKEGIVWFDTALGHVIPSDVDGAARIHIRSANQRRIHLQMKRGEEYRGFSIRGGAEYGLGIYVSKVDRGGSAEKNGLRCGDEIVNVNGDNLAGVSHASVVQLLRESPTLVLTVQDAGRYPAYKEHYVEYSWIDVSSGAPGTLTRPRSAMENLPTTSRKTLQKFPSDSHVDRFARSAGETSDDDDDDEDLIATWKLLSKLNMEANRRIPNGDDSPRTPVDDSPRTPEKKDMLRPHATDIVMLERIDADDTKSIENNSQVGTLRSRLAVQALQNEAYAREGIDGVERKKREDLNSLSMDRSFEKKKTNSIKKLFSKKKRMEADGIESTELSVMGKVKQRSRLSDSYDISGAVEEKNRRNGRSSTAMVQQEEISVPMYDAMTDGNMSFSENSSSGSEVYPGLRKGSNVSSDQDSLTHPGLRRSSLIDKEVVRRPTTPNAKYEYEIQRPTGTSKMYKARMEGEVYEEIGKGDYIVRQEVEAFNTVPKTGGRYIKNSEKNSLIDETHFGGTRTNGHHGENGIDSISFTRKTSNTNGNGITMRAPSERSMLAPSERRRHRISVTSEGGMTTASEMSLDYGSYTVNDSSSALDLTGVSHEMFDNDNGVHLIRSRPLHEEEEISLYWDTSSGTGTLHVDKPARGTLESIADLSDSCPSSRSESPTCGSYDVTPPNESPAKHASPQTTAQINAVMNTAPTDKHLTNGNSVHSSYPNLPAKKKDQISSGGSPRKQNAASSISAIEHPNAFTKVYITSAPASEADEEAGWQEWLQEDITAETIIRDDADSGFLNASREESDSNLIYNPLLTSSPNPLSHQRQFSPALHRDSPTRTAAITVHHVEDSEHETYFGLKKDDDTLSTVSWNTLRERSKSMNSVKASPSKTSVVSDGMSWADFRGSTPPPRSDSPAYQSSIQLEGDSEAEVEYNLHTRDNRGNKGSYTFSNGSEDRWNESSVNFSDDDDDDDVSLADALAGFEVLESSPYKSYSGSYSPSKAQNSGSYSPSKMFPETSPSRQPEGGIMTRAVRGFSVFDSRNSSPQKLSKENSPKKSPSKTSPRRQSNNSQQFYLQKQERPSPLPLRPVSPYLHGNEGPFDEPTQSLIQPDEDFVDGADLSSPHLQPFVVLINKTKKTLGMSISGGSNSRSQPQVRIKDILPGGAAAAQGALQPGMRILSVDGHSLQFASHTQAVAVIRNAYLNKSRPHMEIEVSH